MKWIASVVILLTTLPNTAYSDCYRVNDFKGYKVFSSTGGFGENTWNMSSLEITFDGENSKMPSGSADGREETRENTLVCSKHRDDGAVRVEVCSVFPEPGVLVMTRQASGLGARIDGAEIYSGKVVSTCDQ